MAARKTSGDNTKRSLTSHSRAIPDDSTWERSHSTSSKRRSHDLILEVQTEEKEVRTPPPSWPSMRDGPFGSLRRTPSSTAAVALQALKHLRTPVLVLSSTRKVVITNEAMGRLLTFGNGETEEEEEEEDVEYRADATLSNNMERLTGRTLSEIGIDIARDDQRLVVNWEVRGFFPAIRQKWC